MKSFLLFALSTFSLTVVASSLLDGTYQGKIKLGSQPVRNGILHIREVHVEEQKQSLIAVLAADAPDGKFGETLPFQFDQFISLNANSGVFRTERTAPNSSVGTQIVELDVLLGNNNELHGMLRSNLISPDGAVIEGDFVFHRVNIEVPTT